MKKQYDKKFWGPLVVLVVVLGVVIWILSNQPPTSCMLNESEMMVRLCFYEEGVLVREEFIGPQVQICVPYVAMEAKSCDSDSSTCGNPSTLPCLRVNVRSAKNGSGSASSAPVFQDERSGRALGLRGEMSDGEATRRLTVGMMVDVRNGKVMTDGAFADLEVLDGSFDRPFTGRARVGFVRFTRIR